MKITNEKIKQLEEQIESKKSEILFLEQELKEEYFKEYTKQTGIKTGSKVKEKNSIYIISNTNMESYGWLKGRKILKNGDIGKQEHLIFGEIELIKEG